MAKLTILKFPDERLRIRAVPVNSVDDEVRQLTYDMLETMYAASGIGLAATQVDVHRRVIVIDVSKNQSQPWVLINPEVTLIGEERTPMLKGCLSVSEHRAEVPRALRVLLKALDRDGVPYEIEADGLLAHCLQHELDHLEGVLFIDYLSPFKRALVLKRIKGPHHLTS